jgi:hypothetical protein
MPGPPDQLDPDVRDLPAMAADPDQQQLPLG